MAEGMRTHWCGELRPEHVGQEVRVCGWVAVRREHGEHLAFLNVRDRTGIVQCVIDNTVDVRREYVVRVSGTVRMRPGDTTNPDMPTGEVEVGDCTVEVLGVAEPPPFPIDARADDVDESVRTDWLTVVKVSAFFLSQVVLIDLIGWPLAVVVVFGGAAWSLGAKRWWKALLVGLVIGVVTQLVFGSWLGLSLPAGPLLNGIPIFHG